MHPLIPILEIAKVEEFIVNNEASFLERFCFSKDNILASISFTSTTVQYTWIDNSGMHISDSTNHEEFYAWMEAAILQNNANKALDFLDKRNLKDDRKKVFL